MSTRVRDSICLFFFSSLLSLSGIPALRERGVCCAIGITGLPLAALRSIIDRIPKCTLDVVLSYCHYSLLDDSLSSLLPHFAEMGIVVINASPLAMGPLTVFGPPEWHPAPPEMEHWVARQVAAIGPEISRLAVRFSAKNTAIATTLIGMQSEGEVERTVEALGPLIGKEKNKWCADSFRATESKMESEIWSAKEVLLVASLDWGPWHNATWPSGKWK